MADQPGLVRTYVKRRFGSLWRAIFENAFSRIWLGVHWRFDAFDYADAADGMGGYVMPHEITYSSVWTEKRPADVTDEDLPIGGVPLGLGIANDIFGNEMRMAPELQEQETRASFAPKISNTTYGAF